MNILLWVLQILLALHTLMGAFWKFSNPEQTVASLSSIPHGAWLGLSIFEILCALLLVLPAFSPRLKKFISWAALGIAAEMLFFCGLHLASGDGNFGPMIYWLVVAVVAGLIAYGRRGPKLG